MTSFDAMALSLVFGDFARALTFGLVLALGLFLSFVFGLFDASLLLFASTGDIASLADATSMGGIFCPTDSEFGSFSEGLLLFLTLT